jgi:DNA-binding beta-propeller fold protein YncE
LLLQIGTKGVFDSSDGTHQGTPLNVSKTLLNRPADIAVDPANGEVYIADGYGNHRIIVFDAAGKFVRQWGEEATAEDAAAGVGGKFRGVVHSVNLGRDGNVYACDRGGDRIQVFTKAGAYLRSIWINKGAGSAPGATGSAWDMDFSPDTSQTQIYNTNGWNEVLNTIDRQSGTIVSSFGRPGHMAGEFTYMHTLAADSAGNLYVGETIGGRRVQKVRPTG